MGQVPNILPGRRIVPQRSAFDLVYRLSDAICVGLALAASLYFAGQSARDLYVPVGTISVAIFYVVAELTSLYRRWRGTSCEQEIFCVLLTWTFTALSLVVAGFVTKTSTGYSRLVILSWFSLAPLLLTWNRISIRILLRWLRARGYNTRGFAIVGVNQLSMELARNIENSPELGLKLVGFFDDRPADRTGDPPSELGRRIGVIRELVEKARTGQVDMIYIAFPMRAENRIRGVLNALGDTTASVYIVPDFFVFELLHSRWASIGGLPVVSVFENPFYGVDGIVKRAVDLVLAAAALLIAAMPMLIIACLVKLSSPGPIFFRQRRYGLDGCEIRVWKFRTMLVCEDGPRVNQATKADPRITRLGAFLRKSSLDELPQLFNVLEGSMSLVGPRPHASAHNEAFRKMIQGYMLRHKVKPGITGLAQVSGWRGETDTLEKMEKRIECDHRYIREWSLWLDVKILLKTVLVVFSRQNAY